MKFHPSSIRFHGPLTFSETARLSTVVQDKNCNRRVRNKTGAWAVFGFGEESGWTGFAYDSLALGFM